MLHATRSIRLIASALAIAMAAAPAASASDATPGGKAAVRPMVIANGGQVWDLYWRGELTDGKGQRWDIGFLPGIAPTAVHAWRSWRRAGTYVGQGAELGGATGRCFAWAWRDVARDFLVAGVARDYAGATAIIDEVYAAKPFGWYVIATGQGLWGYVLKPCGRVIGGTVGCVIGTAAGTALGVGGGAGGVAIGAGDAAIMGVAYPAARLAWHHPAWLASLPQAEPDDRLDGRFGMRIIARPGR